MRVVRRGRAAERVGPVRKFWERYLTDVWNVPNGLTMLRMAMIPLFAVFFAIHWEKRALAVFLLASATDWLDGYLARKHGQVTAFGKLMDPLADKLMVCTALTCQGVRGVLPWPAIFLVMSKELALIAGGMYLLSKGVVVYAHPLGKAAQVSFIAALILSFWHREYAARGFPLDRAALWVSVAVALAALIEYALSAVHALRRARA